MTRISNLASPNVPETVVTGSSGATASISSWVAISALIKPTVEANLPRQWFLAAILGAVRAGLIDDQLVAPHSPVHWRRRCGIRPVRREPPHACLEPRPAG